MRKHHANSIKTRRPIEDGAQAQHTTCALVTTKVESRNELTKNENLALVRDVAAV